MTGPQAGATEFDLVRPRSESPLRADCVEKLGDPPRIALLEEHRSEKVALYKQCLLEGGPQGICSNFSVRFSNSRVFQHGVIPEWCEFVTWHGLLC
jgi:hypothetical protein